MHAAQWQSEAHYIFVCYQKALLSLVGMEEAAAAGRGEVLQRLEEAAVALGELLDLACATPMELQRAKAAAGSNAVGGSGGLAAGGGE